MPSAIKGSKSLPGTRQANVKLLGGLAERRRRERTALIRADLAAYAAECLMIRTKSGAVGPLVIDADFERVAVRDNQIRDFARFN